VTTFLLHIGRHKSGTKSIQRTLSRNATVLAAQGIDYPLFPNKYAHHDIPAHLTQGRYHSFDRQAEAFAHYQAFVAARARSLDDRVAIFSSEAFQYVDPRLVATVFPPGRTQVIGYLREQTSYVVSSYCQGVQTTKVVPPIDDYARHFRIDYFDFARKWRKVFGRDYVEFRIYHRPYLHDGNVVADFFEALGKAHVLDDLDLCRDENPSIGGAILEINRRLNTSHLTEATLLAKAYDAFNAAAGRTLAFRWKPCLSAEAFRSLRERHRATNDKVCESIIGRAFPEGRFCDNAVPLTDRAVSDALQEVADQDEAFREFLFELLPTCQPLDLIGRNVFDTASGE
jgi:hypothetical protein